MSTLHITLWDVPTDKALKTAEMRVIEHALIAARYNQSKTARDLGISRGSLRMKLKEYFHDKYIA